MPHKDASERLPYLASFPELDIAVFASLLSELKQTHASSISQIQAFQRHHGFIVSPRTPRTDGDAGSPPISPGGPVDVSDDSAEGDYAYHEGAGNGTKDYDSHGSSQLESKCEMGNSLSTKSSMFGDSTNVEENGEASFKSNIFGDSTNVKESGEVTEAIKMSTEMVETAWWRTLSLRDHWNSLGKPGTLRSNSKRKLRKGTTSSTSASLDESVSSHERVKPTGLLSPFISQPYSSPRLCWDLCGMIVFAVCDLIVLPLTAFPLKQDGVLSGLNYVSAIFWSIDLLLNFCAGYTEGENVVVDTRRIAWKYIRSWFFIDVAVVIVEWVSVTLSSLESSGSNVANYGSFLKVLKAGRMLRLIRFLKVKTKTRQTEKAFLFKIESEHSVLMLTVLKIIAFIVVLCHELACLFYFIGDSTAEGSISWIDTFGRDDVLWLYSCSWHWSVTQFTAASTNVHPMNTAERIFNMVVVLVGMFVFSGVISSLTNSLMTLRKLWEEDSKKFSILRRFLQQQNVPNTLVARIVKYIEYQMSHRTNVLNEGDVDMLKMLTDGLRKELNYEIRIKHLVGHPLFVSIDEATSATINRLIGDMQIVHVAVDDYLFFHQEASEQMYVTVRGEFRYLHNGSGQETCVGVKEWLCEAALWTDWMNVGDLRASTESELLGILPKDFFDVVQSNPHIIASCVAYAIAFMEQLRDLRVLSDVFRGSMGDLIDYRYQEYVLQVSTRSEPVLPLKEWCTSRISGRRSSAGWLPIGRIPSLNTRDS